MRKYIYVRIFTYKTGKVKTLRYKYSHDSNLFNCQIIKWDESMKPRYIKEIKKNFPVAFSRILKTEYVEVFDDVSIRIGSVVGHERAHYIFQCIYLLKEFSTTNRNIWKECTCDIIGGLLSGNLKDVKTYLIDTIKRLEQYTNYKSARAELTVRLALINKICRFINAMPNLK